MARPAGTSCMSMLQRPAPSYVRSVTSELAPSSSSFAAAGHPGTGPLPEISPYLSRRPEARFADEPLAAALADYDDDERRRYSSHEAPGEHGRKKQASRPIGSLEDTRTGYHARCGRDFLRPDA